VVAIRVPKITNVNKVVMDTVTTMVPVIEEKGELKDFDIMVKKPVVEQYDVIISVPVHVVEKIPDAPCHWHYESHDHKYGYGEEDHTHTKSFAAPVGDAASKNIVGKFVTYP